MGKVSPVERQSKVGRQKWLRSSKNKYLKPGALAHIRNSKAASKSCTDIGKKRVAVNTKQRGTGNSVSRLNKSSEKTPKHLSPVRFQFAPVNGPADAFNETKFSNIPSTPCAGDCKYESRLESLPVDLLVKILCHLHHDQLIAVFHISQKIRKAVIISRLFHFNYSTPDRTRQEMLNTMTPHPTDHWPFMSKRGGNGTRIASPRPAKAPKHGPRPPSRLKFTEMRQITAVLFQESSFTSKCLVPSVLQKPYTSHWPPIEFYSMRMNSAKQSPRTNSVEITAELFCLLNVYSMM